MKELKIKTTYIAIISLCIFSFLIPLLINYSGCKGMEEYLYHISVAKGIFTGENYFSNTVYGPIYPFVLSVFFMIVGNSNPFSVELMDFLFLSLTNLIVFLIIRLLCKDDRIALLSSILFVFITHFTIFLGFHRELVDFSNFFIALTLLTFLWSYKIDDKKIYALSLVILLITGLVKYEFMILIYLFIIGLFLYDRLKSWEQIKKLLIPFAIFLVLSAYYVYNYSFTSEGRYSFDVYSSIFWIRHPYIKPSLLGSCIFERIQIFSAFPLMIFLPLFFIGIFYGLKKYRKHTLFLLLSFILLNIPYLMSITCRFQRYSLYTLVPFAILCSFSFVWITKIKINKKYIITILVGLMLFLSAIHVNLFYTFETPKKSDFFEKDYSKLSFLSNNEFDKTVIIVPLKNEKELFRYWIMRETTSIQDILQKTDIYKKKYERKYGFSTIGIDDEIFKQTAKEIEASTEKNEFEFLPEYEFIYFIETNSCEYYKELCDLVMGNYNLGKVYKNKEIEVYRIYGKIR